MTPPALTDAAILSPNFVAVAGDSSCPRSHAGGWAADLSRLTRPRIAVMVLATVASASWLTAGRPESMAGFLAVLVGTALVAASSSVANQICERGTDRSMARAMTSRSSAV
jgi:heme O synthase-like polyprenyltransferase